ncbi:unnamed protein product [Rotaria sp. Silwood2]|nr:unnamed protein product [Rotaria sp. Silwood2]CAF4061031.1 unnamed protein product [Rotaria sp. Silwood2]
MLCILLWWQQLMLIELGFNIFIWCYGFYYFIHILSLIIRFTDGRFLILSLLGWKHGCKVMWIADLDVAKKVLLTTSSKGSFIEEKIATPAWSPVLSLESVNGDLWIDLKSKFLIFQKYLPSAEQFTRVVRYILSTQDANIEIDAKQVVRITLACFVKWIFNRDWDPEWDFVCEASWEWRKELAVKGKADPLLKFRTIDWLIDLINHSNYYHIFGEQWSTPECYSVIMQPFILSPMINISDIAVSASRRPDLSIQELIHYYHPFPIIERYIDKDIVVCNDGVSCVLVNANTQVFIPLDTIGQQEQYHHNLWTPFGIGPRKCLGSQYAVPLLTEFITHCKNSPKFVPYKNHKYSGRNNDNLSFHESIYQLVLFAKILIRN